jgi:uncharacterized protein YqcC (DUF446 family)
MSDTVKTLLVSLEAELKHLSLWRAVPPSPAAMASVLPFCYDTMALEQWLQYVFIPRLQALLDANRSLPDKMSILPMAEHAFAAIGVRASALLIIIQRLDTALSGDV